MRLIAAVLLGLSLLILDESIFVSCQDNVTVANETATNETLMDGEMMMATIEPSEDAMLIAVESEVPSETDAPSEEATMAGTAMDDMANGTVAPSLLDDEMMETMAPTMEESEQVTLIDVDDGGSDATDLDELAQEPVGNVTLETDETVVTDAPVLTEAPTSGEMETDAPMDEDVATEPPVDGAPDETGAETTSPTGTPVTSTGDVTTTDETGEPATECAVQVSNTDPVCGQLLKFTPNVCDCYNFCSGKLIACLEFGQRNSFSCSGETVAGCTADQKISAAPQRLVQSLSIILLAALPAMLVV